MSTETEYTPGQLRRMDDDEARSTLTVDQYERYQKVQELYDDAEETRQQWADADETVTELALETDAEALGTEVDLFGNSAVVHINSEDDRIAAVAEQLEGFDLDAEDGDGYAVPDDADVDELADVLTELLDLVILQFNSVAWGDVPESERRGLLADAREEWGIDGLLLAWVRIVQAVNEDREERLGAVESFHGTERRGSL